MDGANNSSDWMQSLIFRCVLCNKEMHLESTVQHGIEEHNGKVRVATAVVNLKNQPNRPWQTTNPNQLKNVSKFK